MGGLRRHHRRLGVEFEIRVSRRHALRRANRFLRNRDGVCAGGRIDGVGKSEPHGRSCWARPRRMRLPTTTEWSTSCRGSGCRLLPVLFVAYVICRRVAETNRHPASTWSRADPKSSRGSTWSNIQAWRSRFCSFMAEYANMIAASAMHVPRCFFLGGWLGAGFLLAFARVCRLLRWPRAASLG